MAVPVAAWEAVVVAGPDLDEPDAAFQQSPSDQTLATEILGFLFRIDRVRVFPTGVFEAVHLQDVLRLTGNAESFRGAELHFRSEFVRPDAGIKA